MSFEGHFYKITRCLLYITDQTFSSNRETVRREALFYTQRVNIIYTIAKLYCADGKKIFFFKYACRDVSTVKYLPQKQGTCILLYEYSTRNYLGHITILNMCNNISILHDVYIHYTPNIMMSFQR